MARRPASKRKAGRAAGRAARKAYRTAKRKSKRSVLKLYSAKVGKHVYKRMRKGRK